MLTDIYTTIARLIQFSKCGPYMECSSSTGFYSICYKTMLCLCLRLYNFFLFPPTHSELKHIVSVTMKSLLIILDIQSNK